MLEPTWLRQVAYPFKSKTILEGMHQLWRVRRVYNFPDVIVPGDTEVPRKKVEIVTTFPNDPGVIQKTIVHKRPIPQRDNGDWDDVTIKFK